MASRRASPRSAPCWCRAALRLTRRCATPPKPRELEAYELLRKSNNIAEAARSRPTWSPAPRSSADKSREEWESNDLEDSRRDAIMANIKLKTALALIEQEQLKAKIQTLSAEQAKARGRVHRPRREAGQRDREAGAAGEVRRGAQDRRRRQAAAVGADDQRAAEGAGRRKNGWRCSWRASRRSRRRSSRCARPTRSTRRSSPRPSTAPPATCWRRRARS